MRIDPDLVWLAAALAVLLAPALAAMLYRRMMLRRGPQRINLSWRRHKRR